MEKVRSNRKLKQTLSKLMFTLLFIITAISIMHPDYVHAEGNYTNFNGNTDNGEGAKVGEIYWGGSSQRTCVMFFVLDNNTHKVITHGNNRIAFRVFKDEKQKETYNWCQAKTFKNHFGEDLTQVNEVIDNEMPYPVIFNEAERRWSGNGGAIDEWLFSEVEYKGRKYERWQALVLKGYGAKLGSEILKELQTNQEITLAVEPLAWNCIYKGDVWGDKPANTDSNEIDKSDYYDAGYYGKGGYKPLLLGEVATDDEGYIKGTALYKDMLGAEADHIFRYASTGMYSATYANMMAGGAIPNGGINWKFTNEALGYSMTLEEQQLGIQAIKEAPRRQPSSTFSNESLSFALALFNAELKKPPIHSYDIDTKPNTPAKCQYPDPNKQLDGEVVIKKVYYTYNKGNSVIAPKRTVDAAFETKECTNTIIIMDEEKETGYKLQNWGTSDTNDKLPGLPEKYKTLFKVGEDEFAREEKWDKPIFRNGIQKGTSEGTVTLSDNEHYIYLLYCKTEEEPEPEYSDSNWEIPESYLTKSAYFSSAKPTKE